MNSAILKKKIRKAGFRECEVAREIGVSHATFSRKINGKSEFTLSEVCSLCKILKITNPVQIFLQ